MHWTPTTRLRQGRSREGLSEGSRRQSCEPLSADKAGRNTNIIEGRPACAVSTADRHPRGESAQPDKALWFGGHLRNSGDVYNSLAGAGLSSLDFTQLTRATRIFTTRVVVA